jgi:hypothetical protein
MFLIDSGDARNRFGLVIENLVGDVRRNTSRDIQKRTSAANVKTPTDDAGGVHPVRYKYGATVPWPNRLIAPAQSVLSLYAIPEPEV